MVKASRVIVRGGGHSLYKDGHIFEGLQSPFKALKCPSTDPMQLLRRTRSKARG